MHALAEPLLAEVSEILERVRRDNQDETGATIRMRLAPGMG